MRSSRSATVILSRSAAAPAPPLGRPSIASSAALTPFHTVESGVGRRALTRRSVSGPCPFSSVSRSTSASVDGSQRGSDPGAAPDVDAARPRYPPKPEAKAAAAVPGSGPPCMAVSSSAHTSA